MSEQAAEDYGFMDVNVDEAQELATVPEGTEVELEITRVTPNSEKSYIQLTMKLLGHEFTQNMRHWLTFPKPDDDSETKNKKLLRLKSFNQAFGLTETPRSPEAYMGLRGWAILRFETDEQYGDSNSIKSVVNPK